jgi:hypothetical protein
MQRAAADQMYRGDRIIYAITEVRRDKSAVRATAATLSCGL